MAPPTKKRKLKESKTEEVIFDPSARFDYLTGFHKRKVERANKARETAAQKARQEKIENRKSVRDERKADLEAHVKAINALLPVKRPVADSEDESHDEETGDGWEGLSDPVPEPIDHEAEYIDEDKYTIVTVEEVDVSHDGITRVKDAEEANEAKNEKEKEFTVSDKQKKSTSKKVRDKDRKPKKKKKSFRYESPADRKQNRFKERERKTKAAKARRGE